MRFPEFSGEWENTSLGEIGTTFNGLTGKSGSDFGRGFPYITYKSIFDDSRIDISRVEYVKITDVERKKKTQNKVQYGDVFFTTSSETPDEVGMSSVLLDEVKDCYLNSFCFGYRLNSLSRTIPEFMRFYLRSQTIRKKMFVLAQGSTRFNISKSEVMGISINIPEVEEQRKIANLLTLLDDRIATQNKIIEKIESLIKGIRQKIFAQQQGDIYRLGDFLTEYSERNVNNNLIVASVGKYGIRRRDDVYTKELSSDYSKNKIIRQNTLTIGMGSSQIDIGILLNDETYCVSPAYTTFSIHNINAAYLQEYLQNISRILSSKYMITSVRQGKSVNKEELLAHKICICSSDEQHKIATSFVCLYKKLENEKSLLKQLYSQKRFVLQAMFI